MHQFRSFAFTSSNTGIISLNSKEYPQRLLHLFRYGSYLPLGGLLSTFMRKNLKNSASGMQNWVPSKSRYLGQQYPLTSWGSILWTSGVWRPRLFMLFADPVPRLPKPEPSW